jgi:hypothetical protein
MGHARRYRHRRNRGVRDAGRRGDPWVTLRAPDFKTHNTPQRGRCRAYRSTTISRNVTPAPGERQTLVQCRLRLASPAFPEPLSFRRHQLSMAGSRARHADALVVSKSDGMVILTRRSAMVDGLSFIRWSAERRAYQLPSTRAVSGGTEKENPAEAGRSHMDS